MYLALPKSFPKQDAKEIKRIVAYAYSCGIRGISVFTDFHNAGENISFYNRLEATITISSSLPSKVFKYTLLHELGHYLQDVEDRFKIMYAQNQNVISIQNDVPTEDEKEDILNYEKNAWERAELVSKVLEIKLPKDFYTTKAEALESYKNMPEIKGFKKE